MAFQALSFPNAKRSEFPLSRLERADASPKQPELSGKVADGLPFPGRFDNNPCLRDPLDTRILGHDALAGFLEWLLVSPSQEFSADERMSEEQTHTRPVILGDVLYAKAKAHPSEQDWVTLVQSIAAGDQLALHALYEMAHRPVFTLIMRMTANRETAEELTIDVFHDVWRRASRYDAANGTVLGWIMNQARSRAIDRLRFESRQKRSQDAEMPRLAEATADPHHELQLREQAESLRAAVAALTPDERQAIEITFFTGLTHVEAAARLNQPLGTIKTRIRAALHKLRQRLATEAEAP